MGITQQSTDIFFAAVVRLTNANWLLSKCVNNITKIINLIDFIGHFSFKSSVSDQYLPISIH